MAQVGGFGPGGGDPTVTAMLSAYVAVPQLIASVIAFLTREATVATGGITSSVTTVPAGRLALPLGLEDNQHETVRPAGRRGAAARAFSGDLDTRIGSLPHEAGVRNRL